MAGRNLKVKKTCRFCQNTFSPFTGREKSSGYCSPQCYLNARWGKSRIKKCYCLACNKKFTVFRSDLGKFCSRKCAASRRKNKPLDQKHRQKISCMLKRKPWTAKRQQQILEAGKHRKYGKETRDKLRLKRMQQEPQPNRNTSIELMLQKALDNIGIKYQLHQPVCNVCIPDIIFREEKIAIFVDGNYWHSLPLVKERDNRQNSILREQNWLPIRISETSIRKNVKKSANRIKEILTTRSK